MSSARGKTKRIPADLYETPGWAVGHLLDAAPSLRPQPTQTWLEPSAGSGNIIRAVGEWCEADSSVGPPMWTAVEGRRSEEENLYSACRLASSGAGSVIIEDFLELPPPATPYDVVLGNPPYTLASEFIRKLIEERWAKVVVMLLRAAFLESAGRWEWLHRNVPDTYILTSRPSFAHGSTDSTMYAWLAWYPLAPQLHGKLALLEPRVRTRGFERISR